MSRVARKPWHWVAGQEDNFNIQSKGTEEPKQPVDGKAIGDENGSTASCYRSGGTETRQELTARFLLRDFPELQGREQGT